MANTFSSRDPEWQQHLSQIITTQARLVEADFNLEEFMNLVAQQMQLLTPATGVVVELMDGEDMVYKAATGTVRKHLGLRLKRLNSLSGLCVQTGKILISEDTETDPRVNRDACRLIQARSMVVTPLIYQGNAVGALKVLSSKANAFKDADIKTLQLMAGLIGSALQHQILHDTVEKLLRERTQALDDLKAADEKLRYLAQHDSLTRLPNRTLLMQRLGLATEFAETNQKTLAIFFLDIDNFKQVNDTYGHGFGDALLKAFAARLLSCIRKADLAARLGGDEFIILLDGLADKQRAIDVAEKIVQHIREPFKLQDILLRVTTSVGIAYFDDIKATPEMLLAQADHALYVAKQAGRNQFKVFAPI